MEEATQLVPALLPRRRAAHLSPRGGSLASGPRTKWWQSTLASRTPTGRFQGQSGKCPGSVREVSGSVPAEHIWERHTVEKPEAPPNRGEGAGAAQAGEEGGRGDHLPGGEGGEGLRPNHHAYSGSEQ